MSQPIICFEGPSGIGKTTMCNLLLDKYNIIPEVNLLFKRSDNESKFWYYDRQVDRYQLCKKSNRKSILDGDIFQPIWYNWVCNYPSNFTSKTETHKFYKTKLSEGKITFPDLYIIFNAEVKELRNRKIHDKTRKRGNFEKHIKIIEPLKEYYKFLDQETDIEMKFVEYKSVQIAKKKVLTLMSGVRRNRIDQLKTFEQIKSWLNQIDNSVYDKS